MFSVVDRRAEDLASEILGAFSLESPVAWWIVDPDWTELRARGGATDRLFNLGVLDGPAGIYRCLRAAQREHLTEAFRNRSPAPRLEITTTEGSTRLLTVAATPVQADSILYFAVDVTDAVLPDLDRELAEQIHSGSSTALEHLASLQNTHRFERANQAIREHKKEQSRNTQLRKLQAELDVQEQLSVQQSGAIEQLEAALDVERRARADAEATLVKYEETLARIVHDIRAPLNTIIGFSGLLSQSEQDVDRSRWLDHMQDAGKHLVGTSDLLLQLVTSSGQRSAVEVGPLAVAPVVEGACSALSHTSLARNLNISVDVPSDLRVIANEKLFSHIITNLISNAIEHTPDGGQVRIAVSASASFATFTVSDTGPGVTPGEEQHLFDPYTRSNRHTSKDTGAGLGLAICREYVATMNGSIGVYNNTGPGATFWFDLPIVEDRASRPVVIVGTRDAALAELIEVSHQDRAATRTARTDHALIHAARRDKPKVVFVSDDLVDPRNLADLVARVRIAVSETSKIILLTTGLMGETPSGISQIITIPADINEICAASTDVLASRETTGPEVTHE